MNTKPIGHNNLVDLLIDTSNKYPSHPALFKKVNSDYVGIDYQTLKDQVEALAKGLMECGITKGDKIAILSKNCPFWVVSDLASLSIGATDVPIYNTLSAQEIKYILNDSQAKALIYDPEEQSQKIRSLADQLPLIKHFISLNGKDENIPGSLEISEIIKENLVKRASLGSLTANINRSDVASIIYTSGTTGFPKGVMLTHGNFLTNVEDILALNLLTEAKEIGFSFLPLSHVLERTAGYYTLLSVGAAIYYANNMQTIAEDIQKVSPTTVVSIPRFFEKIRYKIMSELKGVKRMIFAFALWVGKIYTYKKSLGKTGFLIAALFKVCDILVYGKIKKKFGGKIKFFVSGGAPLTREIGRFFEALDITIIEGYGLTESSPVIAVNTPSTNKIGTVGRALKSVQVKLSPSGELLAKGPSIMQGYYNLPKETAEALDAEGWLHTGDIATIDNDGFITIIDRIKEIIVLSNGKKVPPQDIEKVLSKSRYIDQIMVIGEGKNHISALIVPKFEVIEKYAKDNNIKFKDRKDLIKDPKIKAEISRAIEQRSGDLAHYELVKDFTLLAEELSLANEELTPTFKFKRKVISEKYKKEINKMYLEHP